MIYGLIILNCQVINLIPGLNVDGCGGMMVGHLDDGDDDDDYDDDGDGDGRAPSESCNRQQR